MGYYEVIKATPGGSVKKPKPRPKPKRNNRHEKTRLLQ
jgi:hypothetical protein